MTTTTSSMSSNYSADSSHPFYDEMLQFSIAAISMTMAIRQQEVEKAIHTVIAETEKMAAAFNKGMPYKSTSVIDVPPLDQDIPFIDLSCPDACIIRNVQPVVSYIQNKSPKPNHISFAMQPISVLGFDVSKLDIRGQTSTPWMSDLACYIVGGGYEKHKDDFQAKHGGVQLWNPGLQFFRHIRNGCFHGNKFNIRQIRGRDQIDPVNPPKWRTYVMPSDSVMNTQAVMDGFFKLPHMLF